MVHDFSDITEGKAYLMQLMNVRDDAEKRLQELHKKLQVLAKVLGEPKVSENPNKCPVLFK